MNINLVRDKKTGKSKGFCFICYEDQRSTVLAVDNLNGIKVSLAIGDPLGILLLRYSKTRMQLHTEYIFRNTKASYEKMQ